MIVFFTVLACLIVFAVQSWILPFINLLLVMVTCIPSHLIWKTVLASPDIESYAAEHPWRIHVTALLFRWGCLANALISWAMLLLVLYLISKHIILINWEWVYIISTIVFLPALYNASTLNSQANSLSFRLKGGTSELRYRHGQRDLSPDEVLGPIPIKRHGF
jgi:hypothetical protein